MWASENRASVESGCGIKLILYPDLKEDCRRFENYPTNRTVIVKQVADRITLKPIDVLR
jgi:hypothetical protein